MAKGTCHCLLWDSPTFVSQLPLQSLQRLVSATISSELSCQNVKSLQYLATTLPCTALEILRKPLGPAMGLCQCSRKTGGECYRREGHRALNGPCIGLQVLQEHVQLLTHGTQKRPAALYWGDICRPCTPASGTFQVAAHVSATFAVCSKTSRAIQYNDSLRGVLSSRKWSCTSDHEHGVPSSSQWAQQATKQQICNGPCNSP